VAAVASDVEVVAKDEAAVAVPGANVQVVPVNAAATVGARGVGAETA
jgi:hypothetical protein